MTVRPGTYLRDMREAAGLTVAEVARLLQLLGFARGRVGPWYAINIGRRLARIETHAERPTDDQLLTLKVIYPPLHLPRYHELAIADSADEIEATS